MNPSLDDMKMWLKEKLQRDVTVSKVTLNNEGFFLADYVNYSAPATKLVAETEELAIANLFFYLQKQPTNTETSTETKG